MSVGVSVIGTSYYLAVCLIAENHVADDPERPIKVQGVSRESILIEDDVWLGAGVIVVAGVTIGRGSAVAAGCVVTHDVPPFALVAGVPARVVRSRTATADDSGAAAAGSGGRAAAAPEGAQQARAT